MSGTSNTFEAALTIDAIGASDETLCVRHIMATSGSGTPGTWASELAFPPPEAGEAITLRAYELSAKDGSIINLVEREVTLTADRPPIFITSPVCGAAVAPGSTLAVTGRAFVFEAQFTLELRTASGVAVVSQHVYAERGDQESDFTAILAIQSALPIGLYDLVAYSTSAKDGSPQDEFSMQVQVR
ncbi:Gmad2 immunoglobulin-like domain-containing protein [Salinibacterium sp. G-O1]|uniref:Gmad2 immunoglobulin-like domain-containing protein n=1 Tax=Salinibacterium sp. G-O1 TaxID=3046208 RepID=UPI0024BB2947|nr:Gmad2 immunoglobulin-like domain-containing protein [Salinibacterium sp. G-O1]MDJ0333930.1 Gmad2 immunoglobulin-like domain-containing protein [Salinibacterium sp. G-O1]